MGEAGVNIATFNLGRDKPGGDAICMVAVDEPVSEEVLAKVARPAAGRARQPAGVLSGVGPRAALRCRATSAACDYISSNVTDPRALRHSGDTNAADAAGQVAGAHLRLCGCSGIGGTIHAFADCSVRCCRFLQRARLPPRSRAPRSIDAVTVYPSGAEITRIGKVKIEQRRAHAAVHRPAGGGGRRLDPRRGQGDGQARDRLGRHPPRVGAAHRRGGRSPPSAGASRRPSRS